MYHFKWFLVAFFSLTLSFIITGSFFKLWIEYDFNQAAISASKSLEAMNIKLKNERLKQERINMVRSKQIIDKRRKSKNAENIKRIKDDNKRNSDISARKTNLETCDFWRKEYQNTKTERSKDFMLSSCQRASN